ncbi:MAG: WD40/YVTN/BNR-like repeat-containing protein [Bryobacteraceae bacterium]
MQPIGRCLIFLFCISLNGQSISPDLFSGLKWRLIGPFRGGRAIAVSGVPGAGRTFYFGAVDGGIWKTTDAGTVWTPIFDTQPVASIGALEVAPSNPKILYAGTGETDIRSDLATGDGVYKSTDSGRTWKNIGLGDTRQISRIVVDPTNPNIVLVAALGHAYAGNDERGVFLSTNGGETWEKTLNRGPQIGAADLAIAMDEPHLVFAAMWNAHRPPWITYAPNSGPGSGLYRSTDGGKTWKQLNGQGLPEGEWGRVGVAVTRGTRGKRIYATIDAKKGGLFRSDDSGDTWTRVNTDPRITSRAWYFSSITADPNDPDVVYIPNVAFYRLSDGGKTLSIVRGAPGGDDYHQVWIDPENSLHMVLATDQGTTITLNGGQTWSTWYNQPTAQFYHVITDNAFPYHVYGTQQDSGTAAIPSRTDHGQIDSRDWFSVGGSESGYIAPDPKDPNIIYVAGTYGEVSRFDRRMMQSQNIAPWPTSGFSLDAGLRKYRDPWTPVIVFSPLQHNALYLGTQYVMKTLDGGLHWQKISPDLTGDSRSDIHAKPEAPVTVENAKHLGYGVVYTISPSPLNSAEIWAGSDTGLVHLTRNAGKAWSNVTPGGLSDWSKITHIEVSHFTPGEAYVAVDRHRLDDMQPYLFRTRDYGKTWTPIAEGIASHAFLNVVREDPKRKGLLFAGTEFGVYVSFDEGDRWQPLQLNLPVTSVRDLVIHDSDLVIATHGRSFWALDDIAPLRQISHDVASVDYWLFKPDRATRITNDVFLGTPLPPEEPQAQNPAPGAYLDYYLREPPAGEIVLEILDLHGKVVQRFSSRDKPPIPPANLAIAPRWLPKAQQLTGKAGMHRFVWDLRCAAIRDDTSGDEIDSEGGPAWRAPLVLPGTYKVKLTVNGRQLIQPLVVVMDPRSQATTADLIQQFQWAQRAFADMIRARKTAAEVDAVEKQVHDRTPKLDEKQKASLAAVTEGLRSAVTGLTSALNAVESADRRPPAQVIALYLESAKALKATLADWEALKRVTLTGQNP